ncbi:MAG: class I SAM-dependent methyltransferase [Bacteroidota bacterium]
MHPSTGYSALPLVYDRWQKTYGEDYSSLILPRLISTIRGLRLRPTTMLDLACGTGSLAQMLARRGWDVWGVDASEGMLGVATGKRYPARSSVRFLLEDMRDFRLPEKVDLVTCMFDSINHLPASRDVLATFRSVYASLREGGFFVFDVNNERCYRTLWTRNEAVHKKDFSVVLQNAYSPERRAACSYVTVFLKVGDRFERRQEMICERYYPRGELRGLLRKAGFRVRQVQDFSFTADPSVGKIKTWWVLRKPFAR